jgi:hypothetical protein
MVFTQRLQRCGELWSCSYTFIDLLEAKTNVLKQFVHNLLTPSFSRGGGGD